MKSQRFWKLFCWPVLGVSFALAASGAAAIQVPGPLVDTGWVAAHQADVVVLDVRKDAQGFLGTPPGPGQKPDIKKLTGHIPGAVSVPWKQVVTKGAEHGVSLKAMLPSAEAFEALMRSSGVRQGGAVVIAGLGATAKDQAHATRLYFTLKYFGYDNAALLDGGTAQWALEGRPLAYTPESPIPGDFRVTETRDQMLASTQDVEHAIAAGGAQLVDCRTEDFFLGLTKKGGFVSPEHKGHLPGAKQLPFILISDNSGPARLYPVQKLRDVAALKGVDLDAPTIAYCNTGVTASLGWFALHEVLGNTETRLYDGSMHAWSTVDESHAVVSLAESAPEALTDRPVEAVEAAGAGTLPVSIGAPPRSLRTLVEERREAVNRQRSAYLKRVTGKRFFRPPWVTVRQDMLDDYRDSVRAANRMHRDTARLYRDAVRHSRFPWSNPYHDRAEIRHYVAAMDRLDRQEFLDGRRFARDYAPW
jgi:thiosulfate/3-mercaptopyruvate sulfurtransferase